jgi:hypothetical protein
VATVETKKRPPCAVTRPDVPSDQTTGVASTVFSIAAEAVNSVSRAPARIVLIAPSLIEMAKISFFVVTSRSMPMAGSSRSVGGGTR